MRALLWLVIIPLAHGYIFGGSPRLPRAPDIRLFADAVEPPPIHPEVLSESQPRRGVTDFSDAAGELVGVVSPTAGGSRLPALSSADIWAMLEPSCGHLEPTDRLLVRESIEVLLAKVSVAERAERACAVEMRGALGTSAPLPPRKPPSEVLLVLSSVRTARDLLQLNCDAASVCAALLSQALTARTPTWPGGTSIPEAHMAEVSGLLDQQRAMRQLGARAVDLDDDQASAVRNALQRGLGVRADEASKTVRFTTASGLDAMPRDVPDECNADDPSDICIDSDSDGGEQGEPPRDARTREHLLHGKRAGAAGGGAQASDVLVEAWATALGGSDFKDADAHSGSHAASAVEAMGRSRGTRGSSHGHDLGEADASEWGSDSFSESVDPRVMIVLLGGALAGLRAADALPPAAQQQRALESVQLFAPLAHSVGLGGGAFAELESLSYARLFPDSLRRLRSWYVQVWSDADELIPQMSTMLGYNLRLAPSLTGLLADVSVSGRVKTVTSTFRKLLRDNLGGRAEEVRDALALRVVLQPTEDAASHLRALMRKPTDAPLGQNEAEALICFAAYRAMGQIWEEEPGRFKDFVTQPKANGYQSLHTNMRLPDGRVFEVQIRTARMHERAERGSASHNAYRAAQLGGSEGPAMPMLPQAGDASRRALPPALAAK